MMPFKLLFLASVLSVPSAYAQERFVSVTAFNGYQWIDQCEKPALKSEPEVRVAACFSFLKGATLSATEWKGRPICRMKLAATALGGLYDVSLFAAKNRPNGDLGDLFREAFFAIASPPC